MPCMYKSLLLVALLFSVTIIINPFCYPVEEAEVLNGIQHSLCIHLSNGLLPTLAYLCLLIVLFHLKLSEDENGSNSHVPLECLVLQLASRRSDQGHLAWQSISLRDI